MSQKNVEVIRRAYERWNERDGLDAALIAPGFECVASSAPVVGLSGGYQGLEGFTRFLEQFGRTSMNLTRSCRS